MAMCDPIYQDENTGLWHFWDETWANSHGPYQTRKVAEVMLARYSEYLNSDLPPLYPPMPGVVQKLDVKRVVALAVAAIVSGYSLFAIALGTFQIVRYFGWIK